MGAVLRPLGYLWALPNTAVGLLLGLLSVQVPRIKGGAVVFDRAARGFLWLFRLTGFKAITFGHVVLGAKPLAGTLLAHELAHVRQYEVLGPLFLIVYVVMWAFRGYKRHPLERAAVRRAREPTRAGPPGGPA